jgi:hypothetical protein
MLRFLPIWTVLRITILNSRTSYFKLSYFELSSGGAGAAEIRIYDSKLLLLEVNIVGFKGPVDSSTQCRLDTSSSKWYCWTTANMECRHTYLLG